MNKILGLVGSGALALLAGCHSMTSCDAPPTSGSAETIPPLRIPAGLEPPDTQNALRVPDLNEPEKPHVGARCLDAPPPYGVTIAPPPPKVKGKKGRQVPPPPPPAAAEKSTSGT